MEPSVGAAPTSELYESPILAGELTRLFKFYIKLQNIFRDFRKELRSVDGNDI